MRFDSIAVFMLATTSKNGRHKQPYPTYFESRIVPIRETWGQYIPHLYFVFGTNKVDYDFLQQQCRLEWSIPKEFDGNSTSVESGSTGRKLAPKSRQIAHKDVLNHYVCPIYQIDSHYSQMNEKLGVDLSNTITSSITSGPIVTTTTTTTTTTLAVKHQFNVLWTGNCTGEYFGLGPTCRCQEAMRFYNRERGRGLKSAFRDVEWFMFMDDDIYLRPFALMGMLYTFQQQQDKQNNSLSSSQAALVAPNVYRSFEFNRKRDKDGNFIHNCRNSTAFEFPIAQPAIINRLAMKRLESGIHANALTDLHAYWGGTHDALLGMLLWMYAIPTYSFNQIYHKNPLLIKNGSIPSSTALADHAKRNIIYHRVMNRKTYLWRSHEQTFQLKNIIASQYNIADLTGDNVLYNGLHVSLGDALISGSDMLDRLIDSDNGSSNTSDTIDTSNIRSTRAPYTNTTGSTNMSNTTTSTIISSAAVNRIIEEQWNAGINAVGKYLKPMHPSYINRTVFAHYAKYIDTHYVPFRLEHCALLTPTRRTCRT